jgi:uncharacterized protein
MFYHTYWSVWDLLPIPGILLALWAQFRLRSAYARYIEAPTERGLTGADVARTILDRNGLPDVEIYKIEGELTDHYDPTKRAVFLSEVSYDGDSVASIGVAAHEVGHALQHKESYAMLELRMALAPATTFASGASYFIFLAGMLLRGALGSWAPRMMWIGVGLFSVVALFQLITLPVEYDASARAKRQLDRLGLVTASEQDAVADMLYAAALTYVAAMASALLELLRWIMIARGMDRDRR